MRSSGIPFLSGYAGASGEGGEDVKRRPVGQDDVPAVASMSVDREEPNGWTVKGPREFAAFGDEEGWRVGRLEHACEALPVVPRREISHSLSQQQ